MDAPLASLRRAVFRLAEQGAALSALYHRVRRPGCEHLPLKGPVLLAGNHGVWGYVTPALFHLIHQGTGRHPLGLTERGFFRIPLIHTVLPWLGGVEGTRENAMTALRAGSRVVCHPGGAWETFKREARRLSPVELLRRLRDILATDLIPRRHELQVPTLVIQGGRDFVGTAPRRPRRGPAHPQSPADAHPGRQPPALHAPPPMPSTRWPGTSSGSTWTEPPPTP
ncbi:hypothetical protein [Myxococcus xanthus]|uniref:hypothetical protein n=1 Tax=Myxococcus xanthus TaxID=34 RepID=UPI0030065882